MDAALNAAIGPWAQLGIVGSVVIALGAFNVFQGRRGENLQRTIDALHEARRHDVEKCGERFIDMLVKNLETQNRMADGMEAFERVVDKVKPI
jgi:hypothetical protein